MVGVAVAIGGAAGALARVGLTEEFGADPLHLTTLAIALVINTVGAAFLALLYRHRQRLPQALVAGIGVGFLGSFTTWSAVIAASWLLGGAGNLPLAVSYLVATLLLGILAAWLAGGRPRGALR